MSCASSGKKEVVAGGTPCFRAEACLRSSAPWLAVAGMLIAMVATNRIYPFDARATVIAGTDSYSYIAIARAAPGLPSARAVPERPSEPLPYQHAQRLAAPYVLGLLDRVLPLGLERLFLIGTLLALAASAALLVLTLLRAGVGLPIVCAAAALLVLNPYAARFLVAFPALLDQPLFLAGAGIIVLAVVEERWSLLVLGSAVAALGRCQTAMTFIPAFVVLAIRRRRRAPIVSAAVVLAIYIATGAVAGTFAKPSINASTITGLFADVGRVRWSAFAMHFAQCASPVAAALLLLVFLRGRRAVAALEDRHAVLALLALGILASPVLMGPAIAQGNGARLAALALPPLLALVALLLDSAGHPFVSSPRFGAGIVGCAWLGSPHHLYSQFGLSRGAFGLCSVLSLSIMLFLAIMAGGHRDSAWRGSERE